MESVEIGYQLFLSQLILQVTLSNVRDNCSSVYIFNVEAFRATVVKLLFLLCLVWLTETARAFLNTNKVTVYRIKKQDHVIGQ